MEEDLNSKKTITHCGTDLKDTLKIHILPLMVCQLRCSYCYARRGMWSDWNKMMSFDVAEDVIEILKRSTLSTALVMLGGEPTLYPYFIRFINSWNNKCNQDDTVKHTLDITTNGMKEGIFEQLPEIPNLSITFSYHSEEVDFDIFFKNVKTAIDKGLKVFVNVLVLGKRYYDDIRRAKAKATLMGAEVQATLLTDYVTKPNSSEEHEKFIKEISKDTVGIIKVSEENSSGMRIVKDIPLLEFYKNKHHFLEGCVCYQGSYEISVRGIIENECTGEHQHVSSDLNILKNIKKMNKMVCPLEACLGSEETIDYYKEIKNK